jgi:hypothetical protein
MNPSDSTNWQVYYPRHKRRKPKGSEDADGVPYVSPPPGFTGPNNPPAKKSEEELVGDLISELNQNNLDPRDLTEAEIRLLQKKLGYAWYEILGYDEDPTSSK